MFQEELPYEPFFIAINNQGLVIIGSNKKTVTIYVVGNSRCWSNSWEHKCWKRGIVTINTSRRQHRLGLRVMTTQSAMPQESQSASYVVDAIILLKPHVLWLIFSHVLWTLSSCLTHIYNIDTILYPYTLPLIQFPFSLLKSLPKYNLNSELRL